MIRARTSMRAASSITILCALMLGSHASAAGVADLERAQAEYDRGVELKATKPAEARRAFAEAASLFQHAVNEGADTAGIHFNLGNAYVQSGDLGRGIASYLRARQRAPYDPAIAANLATARTDVTAKVAGDAVNDGSGIAWWRLIGERTRLFVSLLAWAAFWSLASLPFLTGAGLSRSLRSVRAASLVLAVLTGATVAIDRWLAATRQLGVVQANEVVVRKGNGDGFEPQVAEALSAGVECMILESRPGWLRVRLADGTEGWVREEAIVRV